MTTVLFLLGEFWPPFAGSTTAISLVWMARRSASDGYPPFIGPGTFTELSPFPKQEQKRLLHAAGRQAFRRWGSFYPVVILAGFASAGAAIGRTLPRVSLFPDSIWVHAIFAGLFAAMGAWLAGRLQARCVRPFLRSHIENTRSAKI